MGLVQRVLFVLLGFVAMGFAAHGATIVYVSKTYVIIDAGSDNGLEKGHKVCFFDKLMSLVGCGPIKAVRPRLAGIVIPKEHASEMGVGMVAKSEYLFETEGAPKATKKEIAKFVKALKKAEKVAHSKEEPEAPETAPAEPEAKSRHRSAGLNYLFSGAMPFSFRVPVYNLLNEMARSGSLWTQDRIVSNSLLGIELFWQPALNADWAFDLRLYYRLIPGDGVIVNYDARDPKVGLRSTTKPSSSGLFVGLTRWWGAGLLTWRGGGGLDVDRSLVQYTAGTVDSAEAETVATVTSQLTALSLRLDGGLRLRLGALGIDFGVGALLPVLGQAQGSPKVPGIRTSVTTEQLDSAGEDLTKVLAHQRSKFGYQMTLGLSALY
jgi:hypothetical protein